MIQMSGCALLYCFQDDLSVFKSIRLKVFKCPNKDSIFFFERRVCLLIFFFFSEVNQVTLPQ